MTFEQIEAIKTESGTQQNIQVGEYLKTSMRKNLIKIMLKEVQAEYGVFKWGQISKSETGLSMTTTVPRVEFSDNHDLCMDFLSF